METSHPIKRFVRETLGCECPDSVFDRIELDGLEGETAIPPGKVVVGQRLLIYLVQADDAQFVARHLAALVAAGRQERDARGYNRFRLVIAAKPVEPVREAAQALFQSLADNDERMHLHVIEPHELPELTADG
jgi:hypothetical protein